jgi:cbb3-type cytochrome oxidase maturation protein
LIEEPSLLLPGIAVAAFFWATGDGQFDDLDTPAHRILWDDEPRSDKGDSPADLPAD